jgi:hypothetical protein
MDTQQQSEVIKIDYEQLYRNEIIKREEAEKNLEETRKLLEKEQKHIKPVEKLDYIVRYESQSDNEVITDEIFWKTIKENKQHMQIFKKELEYLLHEFGTSKPCNRFDVGNSIETYISEFIKIIGFKVTQLPNAKRVDLSIDNYKSLSIKYSSGSDITLHNSNSCINKDEKMNDVILLTPDKLYLITNEKLNDYNIDLKVYLKNTGDGLKLKKSILTKMRKQAYPYVIDININIDKKQCKNRLCSELFLKSLREEFRKLNK